MENKPEVNYQKNQRTNKVILLVLTLLLVGSVLASFIWWFECNDCMQKTKKMRSDLIDVEIVTTIDTCHVDSLQNSYKSSCKNRDTSEVKVNEKRESKKTIQKADKFEVLFKEIPYSTVIIIGILMLGVIVFKLKESENDDIEELLIKYKTINKAFRVKDAKLPTSEENSDDPYISD